MDPIDAIYEDGVIKPTAPLPLPEHTPVRVEITPADATQQADRGEGFQKSAGAWADDTDGLDRYLELSRAARKADRPESES